ncbi:hypothetical protein [Marinobacterium arenosum]|uniref:hypothetical protein n=1 Tax=Marinobacterium arenosum TaxID=2862496 RepID=UPI001C98B6AD|nr:hypothetical protein [Marinobacterium arenosum]MBY4677953.1 hypothetical protein [Marinobacterium arenosum]
MNKDFRLLLIAVALFVIGCTPIQKKVHQQHSIVQEDTDATRQHAPQADIGLVREAGLYLGRGQLRADKPLILKRQLGGPGLQAIEPKTVVEFAAQLSAYIEMKVDIAADVYEIRGDSGSTTAVTDSTGSSTAIAVSAVTRSTGDQTFPSAVRYRFASSEMVEAVLDSITSQFGLSWRYLDAQKSFEIFRYETAVLDLPIPNTDRDLEMNIDSTVLKTTLKSIDQLRHSILTGVAALATNEAKIELTEAGTLLVSDRPANVSAIRRYIEDERKRIMRQALLKVRLYTYDSSESSELGLDWDAVFNDGETQLNVSGPGTGIVSAISGGIAVINPTSKFAGSRVDFDALAEENGLSVEYANDLLTLSGRAVTLSQARRIAYLKSVTGSSSASSDLVQSTLEPGEIDTGLSLYLHPFVTGDDIVLTLGLTLTSLIDLPSEVSGNNRITTPETANRSTSQVVRLRNGGAMAMTGFHVVTAESTETGVASPAFKALGGNSQAMLERRRAVLVITADIVE